MFTDEQRKKLQEPIPPSEVAKRSQAGQSLSYLEGWRVIDLLNRIFGAGGWSYQVESHECCREQQDNGKGPRWHVSYRARCVLAVGECVIADVGHGHGIDKSCGHAIESAEKEAATDALKRSAKSLGLRMGLALYDKEQEHVREPDPSDSEIAEIYARMSSQAQKREVWATLTKRERELVTAFDKRAKEKAA